MKNLIYVLIFLLIILSNRKSEAQATPKDSKVVQEAVAKGDTVKANLLRAQALTMQGNTEEASKIYVRIMERQPDNRDAVQGWLMANMKRTPTGEEDAIKSLEELGKLYPKNTGIIFFKAFIEGEYGHNEEALKGFDKLTIVQPDSAVNWVGKGQVLSAMNNWEEAVKAFDKATSLDPKRFDVWGMKSGALAKTGKFDDAIAAANKGLELSPDNPVSLYNRACVYSLKGDIANALSDLKKAISSNPSLKESARKDEDLKNLYDNEDFKKLTL